MSENKEKKIVFSEKIDSSICGFALGIAFVLAAFFEVYFKIFGNRIVEIVIAIVLLIVGIAGTLTEIGKIKKDDIKGTDDFVLGLILTVLPIIFILIFNKVIINIFLFPIFMFGTFGGLKGIMEIIYSLKLKKRESGNTKIEVMKIIVAITEIIALAVAIIQLIDAIA